MPIMKRRIGESILIGEETQITVLSAENGEIQIRIDSPIDVRVRALDAPGFQLLSACHTGVRTDDLC